MDYMYIFWLLSIMVLIITILLVILYFFWSFVPTKIVYITLGENEIDELNAYYNQTSRNKRWIGLFVLVTLTIIMYLTSGNINDSIEHGINLK